MLHLVRKIVSLYEYAEFVLRFSDRHVDGQLP